MEFETFKNKIITGLGGELIDVELTDASISAAFDLAKAVHQQKGNDNHRRAFEPLPIVSGQRIYSISPDITDCIRFIKPSNVTFVKGDAFSESLYDAIFNPNGDAAGLASYELTLQKLERIQMYTAFDTQFLFDRWTNTIELLDTPNQNTQWLIECYRMLSDDEYRDVLWIFEYTLAECKLQLGYAYRKFQNLPGPAGESSLSGDQMVSEALERKRQLEEEIKNFTDGEPAALPIIFG